MANTIDILGDDAVIDSIIDGSITEFVDDQITRIGKYAFSSCGNLTSVVLPAATIIVEYAFYSCGNLTSVDLPAATGIGSYAFRNSGLISVSLPVVDRISSSTFRSCSDLTSVDLPAATGIGEYAFYSCSKLTSVMLRNTAKVATLYNTNAFTNAKNAIFYVPDALVDDYKAATNWSTYADRIKGLSELPA